jgi:hypothetical protein
MFAQIQKKLLNTQHWILRHKTGWQGTHELLELLGKAVTTGQLQKDIIFSN